MGHSERSLTAPVLLPFWLSAMPRKTITLLLASVVVFVLAILSLMVFTGGRTPAPPPLPNPNGYDDFVKASGLVTGSVGDFRDLDHEELRALVSANAESLRLLRLGLTRQCMMPMDSALTNAAGMLSQLARMKQLVQLLAAEGRLHEVEDRPAEAARSYVDAIRFGNEMSRGGFLITRLVGVACEAIGYAPLAKVVPKLSREDARVVVTELEKVDAGRVAWAESLRNEKHYARYQYTHQLNPITWVQSWWESRGSKDKEKAEAKHKLVIAHERLLVTELALRCAQSEQGHPPARLDELVPNYLSKVLPDPFTGQPLVYRPEGTNWLLYSVGSDGVDDGGRAAGRGWPAKGDILFDSSL
jgi:hypothetical protein